LNLKFELVFAQYIQAAQVNPLKLLVYGQLEILDIYEFPGDEISIVSPCVRLQTFFDRYRLHLRNCADPVGMPKLGGAHAATGRRWTGVATAAQDASAC
jgi:hypothetical protein